MRTVGNFDLEYYCNEVFGGQVIHDPNFDMDAWKEKITNLPDVGNKFDRSFTKVVDAVKQPELGTDIKLTSLLDLHIKGPFEGMGDILKAIDYRGHRGVFVVSDEGYEIVHGLFNEEE